MNCLTVCLFGRNDVDVDVDDDIDGEGDVVKGGGDVDADARLICMVMMWRMDIMMVMDLCLDILYMFYDCIVQAVLEPGDVRLREVACTVYKVYGVW